MGFYSHLESGVNLVWGVGQLESELSLSPAQAVIDDEILGYIARMRRRVDATPERLAVEAVRRVGIGGGFLTDDHTLAHYRQEFFEPGLLLRLKREKWVQAGGRTLAEAAEEKAAVLMAAAAAPALPPEPQRELRRIESEFLANV